MRASLCLAAVLMGLGLWVATAAPAPPDERLCWTTNFDDTLTLLAREVVWIGRDQYHMHGKGTIRIPPSRPEVTTVEVVLRHDTDYFDDNPRCQLRMTLLHPALNGAWAFVCTGGRTPYHVQGVATRTPCG